MKARPPRHPRPRVRCADVLLVASLCAVAAPERALAVHTTAIEEVVVVASKIARPLDAIPAQVSVITAERMAIEQVQEFGDIARYEPAVEADFSTARFGNSGLSIRGIGGNRVALEFDGVPMPQRYDVGNFADSSRLALDPAIVSRIEILRGPGSALYGSDAIGGVVAVTSFDGDELVRPGRRSTFGARTGYFGANDGVLGAASHAWAGDSDSTLAAFSYRTGEEPKNTGHGVADDRIDFDQWQGFGKWTHEFGFGGRLRLSLDYFERDTTSEIRSLLGYARFANTTDLSGDDVQRRNRATLSFEIADRGWLDQASLMLYRQENATQQITHEQRTSRGTPVLLRREFNLRELDYGGELRTRWDFATGPLQHIAVAGAEWDHQRLTESRDGSETDRLTGTFRRAILGEVFPLRDLPKSITNEVGLYAQDEIRLGRVSLVGAIRWDDFSLNAHTDGVFSDPDRLTDLDTAKLTFRAGATVRVWEGAQVYAHYAQGFRAPPAADINLLLDIPLFNYRAIPNPELAPERSDTVELGTRWRHAETHFDAAVYYTDYEDFIESRANLGVDPATGALTFQSRNIDAAHIYGVEANLSQGLGFAAACLDSLRLDAGFHWSRGANDVSGRPLNDVHPLKAIFALNWQAPAAPLSAVLRMTHFGRQGRVDFSDAEFFVPPAANVVDLTLRYDSGNNVQASVGVYNLTNQRYWRYADVRRFDLGDPRIEVAARPGTYVQVTLDLRY